MSEQPQREPPGNEEDANACGTPLERAERFDGWRNITLKSPHAVFTEAVLRDDWERMTGVE